MAKIYGLHDTSMDLNKGIRLVVCTLTDFNIRALEQKLRALDWNLDKLEAKFILVFLKDFFL